jgi:hypothetical protein
MPDMNETPQPPQPEQKPEERKPRSLREGSRKKTSLGEFVESFKEHPFSWYVGILVALITASTALVHFYDDHEKKWELAAKEQEVRAAKEEASESKKRLLAIELKMGGRTDSYDLTKVCVPRFTISENKMSLDDAAFIEVPTVPKWNFRQISEEELGRLLEDKELMVGVTNSETVLSTTNDIPIRLWQSSKSLRVKIRSFREKGETTYLRLFPYLGVQVFDKAAVNHLLHAKADQIDAEERETAKATKINTLSATNGLQSILIKSNNATYHEIAEKLSLLYNEDAAGFWAYAFLKDGFMTALDIEDARFKVDQAQKIGNAFYMHTLTAINNAEVDGVEGKNTVTIEKQLLVICLEQKAIMISVMIPTTSGRQNDEASQWIRNWLFSLSVPID